MVQLAIDEIGLSRNLPSSVVSPNCTERVLLNYEIVKTYDSVGVVDTFIKHHLLGNVSAYTQSQWKFKIHLF